MFEAEQLSDCPAGQPERSDTARDARPLARQRESRVVFYVEENADLIGFNSGWNTARAVLHTPHRVRHALGHERAIESRRGIGVTEAPTDTRPNTPQSRLSALHMNRRQFLRVTGTAGGVGLAGCVRTFSTSRPEATPPPDQPDGFWRWVNLVDLEPPPEEYEVGFDVEITQPWVTPERTARIEATLTNEADVERAFDPALLYNRESENKGIRIWITSNPDPAPKPWCTGGDGIKEDPGGEAGAGPPSRALEPGASYKTIGYVVDDAEVRGCYPSGVYQFPTTQSVKTYSAGEVAEEQTYEVSFSLGVQGKNE